MSVDTDNMRRAANGLEAFAPFAPPMHLHVAQACDGLRASADEIDELRGLVNAAHAALATVPSTNERLMRYRCAALSSFAARDAGWASWEALARQVEVVAHAMLAAERPLAVESVVERHDRGVKLIADAFGAPCRVTVEAIEGDARPPAATVATARPTVTEAQIAEWMDDAYAEFNLDNGNMRSAVDAAVRHALTLAGVIESAEKGAGT